MTSLFSIMKKNCTIFLVLSAMLIIEIVFLIWGFTTNGELINISISMADLLIFLQSVRIYAIFVAPILFFVTIILMRNILRVDVIIRSKSRYAIIAQETKKLIVMSILESITVFLIITVFSWTLTSSTINWETKESLFFNITGLTDRITEIHQIVLSCFLSVILMTVTFNMIMGSIYLIFRNFVFCGLAYGYIAIWDLLLTNAPPLIFRRFSTSYTIYNSTYVYIINVVIAISIVAILQLLSSKIFARKDII